MSRAGLAALVQIDSQFGQNGNAQLLRLRDWKAFAGARTALRTSRLDPGGSRAEHVDPVRGEVRSPLPHRA